MFQMAQDMEKYKAENDGLRKELSLANNKIDSLAKFSAVAQINIIKLQQEEIKNEVVVISENNNLSLKRSWHVIRGEAMEKGSFLQC